MAERDAPETYDVLLVAGVVFFIDRVTRREVEDFLSGRAISLTIDDLTGAEVLVLRDSVDAIYSSSPETRANEKAFRELIDREESGI